MYPYITRPINWPLEVYVNHFIDSSDAETKYSYARIKRLNGRYKLPYKILYTILKGKAMDSVAFKAGEFRISKEDEVRFKKVYKTICK